MALRLRLTKLESIYNRIPPDDPDRWERTLIDTLDRTAARLSGLEFSQNWCDGASNCELAAAGILEVRSSTRSPALWQYVRELKQYIGPTGKLFSAILDQANGD